MFRALLAVLLVASVEVHATAPVIGVLTVPTFQQCPQEPADTGAEHLGTLALDYDCYVPLSYVKMVQAAGAQVVLLPCRVNDRFRALLASVNGFLISGMYSDYQCRNSPRTEPSTLTPYGEAGRAVIEHVLARSDVPLFAECKGFNMLMFVVSGAGRWTDILRDDIDSTNQAAPIVFNRGKDFSKESTAVYQAAADLNAARLLTEGKHLMNRHPYGILPDNYTRIGGRLAEIFGEYVATTFDKQGVEYVSVVESKDGNVVGAATHPEKVLFQFTPGLETPHDVDSVKLNYLWGRWLVEKARRNSRSFDQDPSLKASSLTYNQTTHRTCDATRLVGGNFMQFIFTEKKKGGGSSGGGSSSTGSSPSPPGRGSVTLEGMKAGVVVGIAVGSVVVVALSGGMILWWRRGRRIAARERGGRGDVYHLEI